MAAGLTARPLSTATESRRRALVPWLGAAALYGALAVALTWPLASHPWTRVAPDPVDPLFNTWILWWNAHALPLTDRWWDGLSFFPQSGSLALSEHLLGLAPIATPLVWMTGSPLFAYNVMFVLSFPLSALGAHLLVRTLTGRHAPALVAGLIYGFHPYRASQLSHLQVLSSYGMPVALCGLHLYLERRERKWLVLFGVSWLLQSLANGYYLFYFSVLVLLWAAWFVRRWDDRLRVASALVVAALPVVPFLLHYKDVQERLGLSRSLYEIESFSADITSLLGASSLLAFTKLPAVFDRIEGHLFPGAVSVVLLLTVLATAPRRELEAARWRRRAQRFFLGLAALFVVAAWSWVLWGSWSIDVVGIHVAVPGVEKPLAEAALFLVLALLATRRCVAAFRERSPLGFYVLAAGLLWMFALGPAPRFLGERVLYMGPYAWLMELPGFGALRVPPRFAMPMFLCLAVASGIAFARIASGRSRWARVALTTVVSSAAVLDGWIRELPVEAASTRPGLPKAPAAVDAVLELPLGEMEDDVTALYRATAHGYRLVNGFSGYAPPHYGPLQEALRESDASVWPEIRRWGSILVAVDVNRAPHSLKQVAEQSGALRIGAEGSRAYYYLPAEAAQVADADRPAETTSELRIVPERALENAGAIDLGLLLDGNRLTRWHTGSGQHGGETLIFDLGTERRTSAIGLGLGAYPYDFPRRLIVDARNEKGSWEEIYRGPFAVPTVRGALEDPRNVFVRLTVRELPARYIRLWQVGHSNLHWSVAEIRFAEPR